jgi:hypothetical protein
MLGQHEADRMDRLVPVEAFSRQPIERSPDRDFIAERDLIFDDHMDCGVRLNARGRSFGYYLNNGGVERLENMTLTEFSCELPDHAGWRQTAS